MANAYFNNLNYYTMKKELIKAVIVLAIQAEISKLSKNESYYESGDYELNTQTIFEAIEDVFDLDGHKDYNNWEQYLLKANPIEIWEYYLSVILPEL